MKLYRARIPEIAKKIVDTLAAEELIEVAMEHREEAQLDIVAIMEEFVRRDMSLRERVREHMSAASVPYDQYGKTRGKLADQWGHPTGDDVERYLARQVVENFMISRWIDEVFAEDRDLYKRVLSIIVSFDVDEGALRDEARDKVRNIKEGTVDYEIALSKALKEVKKRHGLIQ